MAEDLIRYDVLVQDALRNVVRKVVTEAARAGLPGEHHFFIAFDTNAPGVRVSTRIKEKYPDEMTIVLQHQFWDLVVSETAFEVGLSFDGISEKLHVPFTAIKGFFDPSVQFGLQFEPHESVDKAGAQAASKTTDADNLSNALGVLDSSQSLVSGNDAESEEDSPAVEAETEGKPSAEPEQTADDDSADVVSLDAFRKKS